MNKYYAALEIVPFVSKADITLPKSKLDLLILAELPKDPELLQLFYKITASIKLIDEKLNYEVIGLEPNHDSQQKLEKILTTKEITKYIIFGEVKLSNSNNLNHKAILRVKNLAKLNDNPNFKKQLWIDFKNFLSATSTQI